ncbi:MAG: 30S ribosomal protein S20 [Chloroflexi bacterium]|nr:30S ribosomal protein S20 [Chloroflexota bacterium]
MANTTSAKKRIRSTARRTGYNILIRSRSRSAVKRARLALAAEELAGARKATLAAIGELDRAAQKGVIHPNNAARRKSRLMKKLNALQEAATA